MEVILGRYLQRSLSLSPSGAFIDFAMITTSLRENKALGRLKLGTMPRDAPFKTQMYLGRALMYALERKLDSALSFRTKLNN